jgi:hypothetical protein
MWQEHQIQIPNFDMASLPVIWFPASSSRVPGFIQTPGRIDATERTPRNANAHQWRDLLCETVVQSPLVGPCAREAEGVRFELTRPFGLPVFKTGAINRSATPPESHICGRKFITQLLHYSK